MPSQKWDQSGPRGAEGVREHRKIYEEVKKRNANNQNKKNKYLFRNAWRSSKQMEGSTAERLLWYYEISDNSDKSVI